jgi:hypothetical protein
MELARATALQENEFSIVENYLRNLIDDQFRCSKRLFANMTLHQTA